MSRPLRREIIYIVKNQNKNKEKVNHVIEAVKQTGGIEYTQQKMVEYRDEALAILDTFENIPVKKALEELVRFTTDRKF